MDSPQSQNSPPGETTFAFGAGFLEDHVGHIITDPGVALLELIANSYDAGATRVDIQLPHELGERVEVSDNGTGMSRDEFSRRWRTLKYNRLLEQGEDVMFPLHSSSRPRKAFGRSGKGRHGAFCFADSYHVETSCEGVQTKATVSRTFDGEEPFHCDIESTSESSVHGTTIYATCSKGILTVPRAFDLVGSKFAVDPEFTIFINGQKVELLELKEVHTTTINVLGVGDLLIHELRASQLERNTRFRGIVWWVNRRMVGEANWAGLDDRGAILDGRTTAAKKYAFVIEADILRKDVKADWTEFFDSKESVLVKDRAREHVTRRLHELLADSRTERKRNVISQHRKAIGGLPVLSRKVVGEFIDEVQKNCPTLSEADLSRAVQVLAKLEQSRSGFEILENLEKCSPTDLDTWNRLIESWDASHAELVLDELSKRLRLIEDLTKLVHCTTSDELHDLQPLFARGLWIFGPEFESPEFTSNRGMATVIRRFLGGTDAHPTAKRPDIVMLPDSSIGAYAADSHDDSGDPVGFRTVVIIELKKGGFGLTKKEVRQAEDYASELRSSQLVQDQTKITAYVLGATIGDAQQIQTGANPPNYNTTIIPMTFDVILRKAHARTFSLKSKLESIQTASSDKDIEETLSNPAQTEFFPEKLSRTAAETALAK